MNLTKESPTTIAGNLPVRCADGWLVIDEVVVGLTAGLKTKASEALVGECRRYPNKIYLERTTRPDTRRVNEAYFRYKGFLRQRGVHSVQEMREFLQGFRADAKNLIDVTMLAAGPGETLKIVVQGQDATAYALTRRVYAGLTTEDFLPQFTPATPVSGFPEEAFSYTQIAPAPEPGMLRAQA